MTGAVLAGGASKRMGRPKAFLDLAGRSLLERSLDRIRSLCDEVVVVSRRPSDMMESGARVVRDLAVGQGPLGGLATALFYARRRWVLVTACDQPFLSADLLARLAEHRHDAPAGPAALVPRTPDGWQPLAALYSAECFKPAQRLLEQGGRKVDDLRFGGVQWVSVDADQFRDLDPDLHQFTNVNTEEELETARKWFEPA
jgi:molybdopterin-guanine dinucleotide biosynthesis protein A